MQRFERARIMSALQADGFGLFPNDPYSLVTVTAFCHFLSIGILIPLPHHSMCERYFGGATRVRTEDYCVQGNRVPNYTIAPKSLAHLELVALPSQII